MLGPAALLTLAQSSANCTARNVSTPAATFTAADTFAFSFAASLSECNASHSSHWPTWQPINWQPYASALLPLEGAVSSTSHGSWAQQLHLVVQLPPVTASVRGKRVRYELHGPSFRSEDGNGAALDATVRLYLIDFAPSSLEHDGSFNGVFAWLRDQRASWLCGKFGWPTQRCRGIYPVGAPIIQTNGGYVQDDPAAPRSYMERHFVAGAASWQNVSFVFELGEDESADCARCVLFFVWMQAARVVHMAGHITLSATPVALGVEHFSVAQHPRAQLRNMPFMSHTDASTSSDCPHLRAGLLRWDARHVARRPRPHQH